MCKVSKAFRCLNVGSPGTQSCILPRIHLLQDAEGLGRHLLREAQMANIHTLLLNNAAHPRKHSQPTQLHPGGWEMICPSDLFALALSEASCLAFYS